MVNVNTIILGAVLESYVKANPGLRFDPMF